MEIDVNFLLKNSKVKNHKINSRYQYNSIFNNFDEIREISKPTPKDNNKYPFTLKFNVSGSKWMINTIIVKLQMFCDKEGLNLKIYDDIGWIFGRIYVIIKGNGTKQYANSVKDGVEEYFRKLNNI